MTPVPQKWMSQWLRVEILIATFNWWIGIGLILIKLLLIDRYNYILSNIQKYFKYSNLCNMLEKVNVGVLKPFSPVCVWNILFQRLASSPSRIFEVSVRFF